VHDRSTPVQFRSFYGDTGQCKQKTRRANRHEYDRKNTVSSHRRLSYSLNVSGFSRRSHASENTRDQDYHRQAYPNGLHKHRESDEHQEHRVDKT